MSQFTDLRVKAQASRVAQRRKAQQQMRPRIGRRPSPEPISSTSSKSSFARPLLLQVTPATIVGAKSFSKMFRRIDLRQPLQLFLAFLIVASMVSPIVSAMWQNARYSLNADTKKLIGQSLDAGATKLAYNAKKQQFEFNASAATGPNASSFQVGGGDKEKFNAYSSTLPTDAKQGIALHDPKTASTINLAPQFGLADAKLKDGHIIYPLAQMGAQLIYTLKATTLKEDIILPNFRGTELNLSYALNLSKDLEAKLLKNGSIGVFGPDQALLGNVSTGSPADQKLLDSARQNSSKSTMVFVIPAPVINQTHPTTSSLATKAYFELQNNIVTLKTTGLKNGAYPLSIDPSIVVASATAFDQGTDEGNVGFDDTNNRLKRNSTTGGAAAVWGGGNNLNSPRFQNGIATYNNRAYVVAGSNGHCSGLLCADVNYSSIEIGAMDGSGNMTWTNSAATTGSVRKGLATVAYNGFLYVLGGCTTIGLCASYLNDVQVARIDTAAGDLVKPSTGATGFDALSNFSLSARAFMGAAAYNNHLYIYGGCNGASCNTTQSDVASAPINADGTLGTWTSTGMGTLPTTRSAGVGQAYNGYLYFIGGSSGGTFSSSATLKSTVAYVPINSDGTLGTWVDSANGFATAVNLLGATVYQGYFYAYGGCSTYGANGNCTATTSTLSYAPVSADGSPGTWFSGDSNASISSNSVFGLGGYLHYTAGCSAWDTGAFLQPAVDCVSGSSLTATSNALIAGAGAVSIATTNGGTNFATATWGQATVVNNGFIYVIGGCTNTGCTTTTNLTRKATLNANGSIGNFASDAITLGASLAGMGAAVVNNTIYITGGWTGTAYVSDIYWNTVNLSTGVLVTASWNKQTGPLGAAKGFHGTFINNGYIYNVGGCTAAVTCTTASTAVERATVAGGANTGTWSATTAALGSARGMIGLAFSGKYVYAVGGYSGSANISSIEKGTIGDTGDITAWANTTTSLTSARRLIRASIINSYLYVTGGFDSAILNAIAIAKIDSGGDITAAFTASFTMASNRWGHSSVAVNGILYNLGGCNAGTPSTCTATGNIVASAEYNYAGVGGRGVANAWASTNSYTVTGSGRLGAAAAVLNGFIYLVGGCNSATLLCSSVEGNIQRATISKNGTLTWSAAETPTVTARMDMTAEVYNGRIYVMGGCSGSSCSTDSREIDYFQPNTSTGVVSSVTAVTSGTGFLPSGYKTGHSSAQYNGYLYVMNGDTATAAVYYSQLDASTGAPGVWNTTTAFTTGRSNAVGFAYNGYIYIAGGFDGTNILADAQYAPLNNDGSITASSWHQTASLPAGIRWARVTTLNGYAYLEGGATSNSNCLATALSTPILANGALGGWGQSSNVIGGGGRQQPAVVNGGGYLYALGGGSCGNSGTITYATQAADYAGSAAISASSRYVSKIMDTQLDTMPAKTYVSGSLGGAGTKLDLLFRCALSSGAVFGTVTNNLAVAIETPYSVVGLDTSSVDQGRARYSVITIAADDSQEISFPDTTSTTVTRLEYFYHANPSRRLRGGKTFAGEGVVNPSYGPKTGSNNYEQSLDTAP